MRTLLPFVPLHAIKRWRPPASTLALLAYLAIAFALTADVWSSPTTSWVGNPGDPYKFMDFLAWIPHAISTGHNPLHMRAIDYPNGVNLAWETPVPLAGVVMWPLTATVGVVAAYNVWVLVALTLNGWCTYLWLRRHTRLAISAFLGGCLLELSPYVSAHVLGHLNLISFFPIPLLFLLVEQLVRSDSVRVRTGLGIGVLAAVQLYLAQELLALVAIGIACGLVVAAVMFRAEVVPRIRPVLQGLSIALLTFALLSGPDLFYQFFGPSRIHGLIHPTNIYVTDLANLVIPTDRTWLRPTGISASQMAMWTGNGSEQTGYIGLPLLVLAVYALIRWRHRLFVRLVAITTLVVEVLSLGPHLHVGGTDTGIRLPAVVFSHLPVLDNLLPGRLSLVAAFGFACLAAIAADGSLFTSPLRKPVASALVVLSVLFVLPTAPYPTGTVGIPAYFTSSTGARALPDGTVALVGPYIDNGVEDAVPMLWQADADYHFSLIDGDAITADPAGHATFFPASPFRDAFSVIQMNGMLPSETAEARAMLTADLRQDGVTTVLIGPMEHRDLAIQFIDWLVGSPPRDIQGVSVWQLGA